MAVLLQSLCELGKPQLTEEAVRTCYMDVACAPFEVIWYSAQALASQEQQPPQAAEALVVDWLCASPPPRTLKKRGAFEYPIKRRNPRPPRPPTVTQHRVFSRG